LQDQPEKRDGSSARDRRFPQETSCDEPQNEPRVRGIDQRRGADVERTRDESAEKDGQQAGMSDRFDHAPSSLGFALTVVWPDERSGAKQDFTHEGQLISVRIGELRQP
jgi:hypothetical protein